jgi:catechol 2,3-dioxygenase-like lactoylglutathione lyase family enzyme
METPQRWLRFDPVDENNPNLVVYALNLVVIRTHDIERSRRFYEALGLKFQASEYGHGGKTMHGPVPTNAPLVLDIKTEGIPPPHTYFEINSLNPDEPIPPMQIGFFVKSVDKAVKAALEAGGTLATKAANWPYGRRAAVRDPDGHRVELSEDPFGRLTGNYP